MPTGEQQLENRLAVQPPSGPRGPSISDYQLLRIIGEGSFGEVWLASHLPTQTYRAIKLLNKSSAANLERELAGLHNYARIAEKYDGLLRIHALGRQADGNWYYVMELGDDELNADNINPDKYEPKTLASEIKSRGRLPVVECIDLIAVLADSLAYLHRHGLIHRDIKPSNVVFVRGQPKLADIGLVTDIGGTHSFAGTKGYTPPNDHSTKQADVYGLGKVLYEISTGRDRNDYPGLPRDLSRAPDAAKFLELNEVILKACQVKPELRYRSASEMKADLALLQSGRSLRQMRTAEKRAAVLKYAAMIALPLILVGAAVYIPVSQRIAHKKEVSLQLMGAHLSSADTAVRAGQMPQALLPLVQAIKLDPRDVNNRVRFSAALDQCPSLLGIWPGSRGFAHCEFSHDGRRIIAAELHGSATVWDLSTGALICRLDSKGHGLQRATLDREGNRAATAGDDDKARIWDIATAQSIVLQHTGKLCSVRFSPDGQELLTGCEDGYAWIWDLGSRQVKFRLGPHAKRLTAANYSADGKHVATSSVDGTAQVWDLSTREPVGGRMIHNGWVNYVSFSPGATAVATASADKSVRIWDFKAGREERILPHTTDVRSVEFSPDGNHVITACADGTVRLWEAHTGQPVHLNPILNHNDAVMHAVFAPDARRFATAGTDQFVRVWDLGAALVRYSSATVPVTSNERPLMRKLSKAGTRAHEYGRLVGASDNERFLLYAHAQSNSVSIRAWDSTTEKWGAAVACEKADNFFISDDGQTLIVARNRQVEAFNYATATRRFTLAHSNRVSNVVFTADSRRFATVAKAMVQVFDSATGNLFFALPKHSTDVSHVSFSHRGDRLVTCTALNVYKRCSAQIWNAHSGHPIGKPLQHADGIRYAVFSGDDTLLATCSDDYSVIVWSATTGEAVTPPLLHTHWVLHAAFAPDSKWLAAVCEDRSVRVWDINSASFITPPMRSSHTIRRVKLSGDNIMAASKRGENATWSIAPDNRPVEILSAIADLFNGISAVVSPTDAGGLTELARLGLTAPSAEEIRIWHLETSSACERIRNFSGALFHLDKLADLGFDDQQLLDRRTRVLEKLGNPRNTPSVTSN